MSEEKMKIQKKELKNVDGGMATITDDKIICKKCGFTFNMFEVPKKYCINECINFFIFKCPNCKSWVNGYGQFYSN